MAQRVEVPERLMLFWVGWHDLSTCRPPSYSGVAPIPWTAVDAYAIRHGLSRDEFDLLLIFIRHLDDELFSYAEKLGKAREAARD